MTYIFVFIVVAVLLFVVVKKINDSVYEKGRILLSNTDVSDFMAREASSLNSDADKAMFHFLVNRPWRESREWFQTIADMTEESTNPDDVETAEWIKSIKEAMLGDIDKSLELVTKLRGLPPEVRKLQPTEYAKWSKIHQNTLKSHPQLKIIRFVSASSVMAAKACLRS